MVLSQIDPILEVCRRYEIPVSEDAAEALGATYRGRSPGALGQAGVFSFNGNKIITTSGGGMLVSPDKALSESLSWDILFDRPGSGGYNGTIESELCIETERKKMPTTTIVEMEGTALPTSVDAEVRYHMDISFRVAITPFVARQNANVYLLMNVGNMLSAGEPMLSLSAQPHWKVPVYCAFPEFQRREKIGELAVDVNSGAILLEQSFPSSPQEIERHAQVAYDSLAASSARA